MFIKVCGIRDVDIAIFLTEIGVSAMGLVFHKPSFRYVPIDYAIRIIEAVRGRIAIFAVFKDNRDLMEHEEIVDLVDFIQIYELPYRNFEKPLVLGVRGRVDHPADYYLIDYSMGRNLFVDLPDDLFGYPRERVIISGGLNESNVGYVMRKYRPFGVDVSSGVEIERGVKDRELIRRFVDTVRRVQDEGFLR